MVKNYTQRSLPCILEEEKEIHEEYDKCVYKASGFMAPKEIKDCHIRRNLVSLNIKCRRWDIMIDGKYQKRSRNWKSVADGTRLDHEYASFLKK